jgi:glycosyltransferase EpsH
MKDMRVDMDDLVSIIIPVYKTEKFIAECMETVLSQDYPNIEVILVDDGSPDGAGAKCDGYASGGALAGGAQHKTVRVIHKENSGIGLSRNEGVKAANGKYVYFLDSDDKLDGTGAISCLVEAARAADADITVSCYRRFGDGGVSGVNRHNLRGGAYTRTARFRFDGFYRYGHLAYNWGKLYKRSFLVDNGVWCKPYPFTQDKAHNMACYACHPSYAFVDESTYLYRVNEESVTFRYKANLAPVWVDIASDFGRLLEEKELGSEYNDLIAFHVFFGSFFVAKQEIMAGNGIRAAAGKLKEYGRYPLVRDFMRELSRGRYMGGVATWRYRLMVLGASVLFTCHGYWLMAALIRLLLGFNIDGRITRSHYGNGTGHKGGGGTHG